MRSAVLLAAFVVLLLAGSSGAGSYFPPPGDCCQQWSPHGTQIVFETIRAGAQPEPTVGVVAAIGGPEHFVPGIPVGQRSPDWTHVAAVDNTSGQGLLTVWNVDGTGKRVLALGVPDRDFAWSPDSKRIAFLTTSAGLAVIRADGSGLVNVAPPPVSRPAWAPNSGRLAYEAGLSNPAIHVVNADGSGNTILTAGSTKANSEPQWSPDGSRLAFWSRTGSTYALTVKPVAGGAAVVYSIQRANGAAIAWQPGSTTVFASAFAGFVGIDVATGKRHILVGIPAGVFSRDGKRITWAAGGECRDRVGIYVANADGTQQRRLTNSCRIIGTPGSDVLHADFSRVVLGLGGNDTLYADDTYYFFDGNTLYGGPGNDRLIGGFGQDILNGGPGNDTLTGGPSIDTLIGGPGHDHIEGGGGGDTIYARDGQRDWISCGKNGYGKGGRDVVYADLADVVASDCEIVHRR
jgi:hypothetical protein